MKAGTENRKKTIIAASAGAVALICIIYAYSALFGGDTPSTVAPTPAPTTTTSTAPQPDAAPAVATTSSNSNNSNQPANMPAGNAAGVDLKKLASTSASLDPTLDESAMLRTEHLVYAGNGRNIFSATYTPPVSALPKPIAPARPAAPVAYVPPPPPPTCPPTCPPLPLKFFGTIKQQGVPSQAFLLFGDDVFLASPNDVVARRYKVVSISANTVQIEDLSTTYTESLPLQSN